MTRSRPRARAATAPDAADPSLRGVTCAVPFEDVWQSALRLASGGLRRWRLEHADDQEGVIRARATRLTGAAYVVDVWIRLDEDAQTRVDAIAESVEPTRDFGTGARLLRRFFSALQTAPERPPRRTASA